MRFIYFICFLVSWSAAHCQFNSTASKVIPFASTSVRLLPSWVKQREELNIKYLQSLEPERLLHNFRVNAGLPSTAVPLEGWESPKIGIRGHFVGHYLSAISSVVEKYQDAVLSKNMNYIVDELYKCQQIYGSGYLSAFPEKDFDVLETKFGGVWAPYYTYHKMMQGLLDVYTRTGNKKAYAMVIDMASYVEKRMAKLSNETIEKVLYSVGANPSNEAGAMNELLYMLYKESKNPKHLALAKVFDRDWFANPLAENQDILSGLHANTHLVLVNGFAQRYSITKEKKYYDATLNFWDMLMKSHIYANGSSSGPRPNSITKTSLTAEHWGDPGYLNTLSQEIAESCVSHNTQKLSATLFGWTGESKYAEAYMNTFYNSVLALQSGHSGKCVYHLPLGSPRKKVFLKENDFRCCNGSTLEAFSLLNTGIYYHDLSTLWVNLYVPSKLSWTQKSMQLIQTANFPMDNAVEFVLSAKKKTTAVLKFLVPSWAKKAAVYINDQKQYIEVGSDSYISLNKEWKDNDTIKLVFEYEFYLKEMPGAKNVIALFYGPSMLAFEEESELILKGNQQSVLSGLSKDKDSNIFRLKNNGKTYTLRPLYDIDEASYGVYATIRNY